MIYSTGLSIQNMIMHAIKKPPNSKFPRNRQDNALRIYKKAISDSNKCRRNSHFSDWIMMSSDQTQIKKVLEHFDL